MYINIVDTLDNKHLFSTANIIEVEYNPQIDMSTITLEGHNFIEVKGIETFNILNSLLKIQGEVVVFNDIIKRKENLNKLDTFQDEFEGPHRFIKLLDNADKTIESIKNNKNTGQMDLAFDSLTGSTLN